MTPENSQKFYKAFPRLYRGRSKTIYESSMCWGFACGDGWFDLIWNLSQAVEETARHEGLAPQSDDWPEVMQVKEKVGTLRFRLRKKSEAMMAFIRVAETASETICEGCGKPCSMVEAGKGLETLCGDCAEMF